MEFDGILWEPRMGPSRFPTSVLGVRDKRKKRARDKSLVAAKVVTHSLKQCEKYQVRRQLGMAQIKTIDSMLSI
jgi:hypothetical protein